MYPSIKRVIQFIIIIVTIFSISACQSYRERQRAKEKKEIDLRWKYMNAWVYSDLLTDCKVRVLYFQESLSTSLVFYPSLIIGVTDNLDTIAIIDVEYPCPVIPKTNSSVVAKSPTAWTSHLKENSIVMLNINVDEALYKSVTHVYYSDVDWKSCTKFKSNEEEVLKYKKNRRIE